MDCYTTVLMRVVSILLTIMFIDTSMMKLWTNGSMRRLLLLLYLAVFSNCGSVVLNSRSSKNRVKRIVHGKPVNENTDYASPRYIASIHYAHYCNAVSTESSRNMHALQERETVSNGKTERDKICPRSPLSQFCSGSLLTPTLVQTACHCVAFFEAERDGFQKPMVINVWEHLFVIYIGAKNTNEWEGGFIARVYIHHQKCSGWGLRRMTFNDYGLIILRTSIDSNRNKVAPLYTIKTLTDMWVKMMAKQTVCLNVGFGSFRMNGNIRDPTPSSILRHGWVRMWDYLSCYRNMSLPDSYKGVRYNYSEVATWFCSSRLSNRQEHPGWGDSGSPVTCDNEYVGLHHQGGYRASTGEYAFSTSMSTAFTAYENSAEFRQALMLFVDLFESYGPEAPATGVALNY